MANCSYDMKAASERIRKCRAELHLKSNEVAGILGVTNYHYGSIDRGDRPMSLKMLISIARLFDVSIDYIIFGTIESDTLTRLLCTLTPQKRKKVIKLVKCYISLDSLDEEVPGDDDQKNLADRI